MFSELELQLFEKGILEKNHYSNILNNTRFRGWYHIELEDDEHLHIVCIFRIPPSIPLYDNVLRNFTEDERKAGLLRLLVGKELREETENLLAQFNGDINECVSSLDDAQVEKLLGRLQKVVTFDFNQIPYLHIKTLKSEPDPYIDIKKEVENHILGLPRYLDIFYDVLNEKISIEEATKSSGGIIFNEYYDHMANKEVELMSITPP